MGYNLIVTGSLCNPIPLFFELITFKWALEINKSNRKPMGFQRGIKDWGIR